MDVVDLCAGDGWFALQIAHVARQVDAIDIDYKLLELAKVRVAESGATNCDFVMGDAYDTTKLVPLSVDLVFLANAFHGVPDRVRLSKAVLSALKPKGRFVVVNWHARSREETKNLGISRGPATELRMTPEATNASAKPSGLHFREMVEVSPYHYGAVFEKPVTGMPARSNLADRENASRTAARRRTDARWVSGQLRGRTRRHGNEPPSESARARMS